MIEPVACPFCGGKNITVGQGSTFRWRVATCDCCGAQCDEVRIQTMGEGTTEEWELSAARDAIEEWNKRAPPEGYTIVPVEQVKDADLALGEAVAALYFDDSSDYSAALWTIVEKLGGKAAYDLLMENGAEAYAKYSAAKGE